MKAARKGMHGCSKSWICETKISIMIRQRHYIKAEMEQKRKMTMFLITEPLTDNQLPKLFFQRKICDV